MRHLALLSAASCTLAAAASLLGGGVLLGRMLGLDALTAPLGDFPAMRSVTALGLVMAGGMGLALGPSARLRRLGQVGAVLLLALALLQLGPGSWGGALPPGEGASRDGGRFWLTEPMSLPVAAGFAALALARLLLDSRRHELRLFGLALCVAALLTSVAIGIAHADRLMQGKEQPTLFSVAPHAALGLALAAAALVLACVVRLFEKPLARPRLVVLGSSCLAAAIACGTWSAVTWQDYRDTGREATAWTQSLVRVLDEQVRRSLDTPLLVLDRLEREIAREGGPQRIQTRERWEALRVVVDQLPQVGSISIFDREGEMVLLSTRFPSPGGNFAFREYFQAHVAGEERHLGPILRSIVSDRFIFTLSRRLEDGQGRFAGVVMATLEVDYYRSFLGSLDLPPGSVLGLLTSSGRFMVREPMSPAVLQADLSGQSLFARHSRGSPHGTFAGPSPVDGRRRLLSFRRADDLGFVVVASLDMGQVTAAFERRTAGSVSILVLVLGVLGASALLQWRAIERQEAQQALAASVLDSVVNHIAILDRDGRILRANAAWIRFGAENGAADPRGFLGANYFEVCRAATPPDAEAAARVAAGIAAVMRGELAEFAHQYRCDGPQHARWFNLRATPLAGQRGAVVVSHEDITAVKRAEEAVRRLAQTDPLTGLANRRAFFEAAERECARMRRHGLRTSVLALDLDHFKHINDDFGHEGGDRVLIAVAGLMEAACRSDDLVARFGGEEFVILLPHTGLSGALVLAERIRRDVEAAQTRCGERVVRVTLSGGVAEHVPGQESLHELLMRADAALYEAKRAGRNRVLQAEPPPARENAVAAAAAAQGDAVPAAALPGEGPPPRRAA